jgi:hypothetical protein
MCQSKAEGGQRCDHDTSDNRRLRRKAANLRVVDTGRASSPIPPQPLTANLVSPSIAKIKQEAEQLRKDIYNAPTDPVERSVYDEKMEARLTKLGMSIGEEADGMVNFSASEIAEKDHAMYVNIINAIRVENSAAQKEVESAYGEWNKVKMLSPRYGKKRPLEESLEDDTYTDEQKDMIRRVIEANKAKELVGERRKLALEGVEITTRMRRIEKETEFRKAYHEVLSQIRPLGGKIQWAENSNADLTDVMSRTVGEHYPSEWLEQHNSYDVGLVLTDNTIRPYFREIDFSETEDDGIAKPGIPMVASIGSDSNIDTERLAKTFPHYEVKNFKIDSYEYNSSLGENQYLIAHPPEVDYNPEVHGALVNGRPEGEGWEYRAGVSNIAMASENPVHFYDTLEIKKWRKVITTTKKLQNIIALNPIEGIVSYTDRTVQTHQERAAYHEFGHRMERVLPENALVRQEKAFLKRRTGKTDETFYDNMLPIVGNPGEFAHDNSFVEAYIGRDYFLGNSYEVFTSGVESIYGGTYGGLVGNDKNFRADLDHRGFTLGALAVL